MQEQCRGGRVEVLSTEVIMANKSPKATQRRDPKEKESAIIKPMLKTGLPPGISQEQARNPGSAGRSKRVRNES